MFGGHYGILILLSTYLAIGYGFMGLSRPGNSLAFWLGGPNGWKAPLLAGTHREMRIVSRQSGTSVTASSLVDSFGNDGLAQTAVG